MGAEDSAALFGGEGNAPRVFLQPDFHRDICVDDRQHRRAEAFWLHAGCITTSTDRFGLHFNLWEWLMGTNRAHDETEFEQLKRPPQPTAESLDPESHKPALGRSGFAQARTVFNPIRTIRSINCG